MRLYRTRLLGLSLAVAALLAAVPQASQAQTKVAADKRLPTDVYVYVAIPSVPELKKRFKGSSYGKLIDDRAFAEFRKEIEVAVKKGSGEFERATGFKVADLLDLPSGEVAFAVVKSTRKVPTLIGFADFGKNEETVDKLLTTATKELKKTGLKQRVIDFEETKITVFSKAGAGDDAASQLEFAYFIKGSQFVFATEAEALKAVIARWDGKHESTFAGTEVYSYIKERTKTKGRTPIVSWYIDPLGLAGAALSNPEAPGTARMVFSTLTLLGLSRFKAMGGSMDCNVGEYDSISKTVMYVQQPTTGALDLFRFPAVKQTPPNWVPANAASYMVTNWDVAKAYAAAATLYGALSFGGADALDRLIDSWAKAEEGPKVHLKKDILDQLTGRFHFESHFADENDPESMKMVIAIGVKDEKKMNAVLEKITRLPSFPGKTRKFKDHTIYEFEPAAQVAAAGRISVCVAKGHLFATNGTKLLESIIRGDAAAKPLAKSEDYKRLAARFPDKLSMLSYTKSNAQIKMLYDGLKSGALTGGEDIGIDFSKLPAFSALEKYLLPSGGYAIPDKNGVYFESISLKPVK